MRKVGSTYTISFDEGAISNPRSAQFVKKDLIIKQRGGKKYGFGDGKRITLYRETMTGMVVPRAYGRSEFGPPDEDETVLAPVDPFNFTKPLRPIQVPLVADFIGRLKAGKGTDAYGGIFNAPCGTGKTVMAIKTLAELGQQAIVLVHTGFLMKQWRDEISRFTDLPEDKIGKVQQDVCDWKDKSIVLAMVESLSRREYEPAMYEAFGSAVFDEVHRHAAATWHKVISMFPARTRIGLSATPRRGDGLWKIITHNIGDVLTVGEVGGTAKVFRIMTGVSIPEARYRWGGQMYLGALLKALTTVPKRNGIIAKEIVKALKSERRVLVLSDRLAHLDELENLATGLWGETNGLRVGRYVGGISEKKIAEARECNLLFGTFQYAKEGLDDPGLDTLMLTVPKGDVEQAIGRILREVEGKKEPLVVDFVDDRTSVCSDFAGRRLGQYSKLGHTVIDVTDKNPLTK